jgi:predicted deacylase
VGSLVQVDDPVAKGQLIANIRNVLGDVIEEIPSLADGKMLQSPSDLSIEPGWSAGQIAYNSTSGEC